MLRPWNSRPSAAKVIIYPYKLWVALCTVKRQVVPRFLIKHHDVEPYRCGQLHAPAALPPGERAPRTHRIGGWVDPTADVEKRKISYPCRESNPSRKARSPFPTPRLLSNKWIYNKSDIAPHKFTRFLSFRSTLAHVNVNIHDFAVLLTTSTQIFGKFIKDTTAFFPFTTRRSLFSIHHEYNHSLLCCDAV
jgi:hypothetical protein